MNGAPPAGWATATIEDCAAEEAGAITDGPYGSNLKTSHYTAEGPRVIRLGNILPGRIDMSDDAHVSHAHFDSLQRHHVCPGDVVMAGLGDPIGRAGLVPDDIGEAMVKADCFRLRTGALVEPMFLVAWLNSPEAREGFLERSHGLGRMRVNLGDVKASPIPIPPLAEQRRIVAKLDRLSARSAAAREHLARTQTLAARAKQATLAAAFRGRLTTQWRNQRPDLETAGDLVARTPEPSQSRGGRGATSKVIEGVGAMSVNDPGSPLPVGWAWTSLRRIARQETGHTPSRSRSEWWGGDIPWIGIRDANAHHGCVIEETLQTTNEEGLANSSARLLPAGTVCLSRTASVGYVTMMGRPMATSQDFATWTCSEALDPTYLMLGLISEGDDIRRFGEGSTHTTIYFPEIRALHIALAL